MPKIRKKGSDASLASRNEEDWGELFAASARSLRPVISRIESNIDMSDTFATLEEAALGSRMILPPLRSNRSNS